MRDRQRDPHPDRLHQLVVAHHENLVRAEHAERVLDCERGVVGADLDARARKA